MQQDDVSGFRSEKKNYKKDPAVSKPTLSLLRCVFQTTFE